MKIKPGIINRYSKYLPVNTSSSDKNKNTPIITLNEGNTPLIFCPKLSKIAGKNCQIFLKFEGLNPTASFKDRGMTMAISKAIEKNLNLKAVICASTGNTSASAAAYASRAGIDCVVILPKGKIAIGKLAQAFLYGAKVISIDGNFDQALEIVREIGKRDDVEIVNSINPFRIEGQKTASFEIIETLGDAPDFHILPVGNAGNITAYWKGYIEFYKEKKSSKKPKMWGVQAENSAPIYHNKIISNPETLATAIRIGNPASWEEANQAVTDSQGNIDIVSDKEILNAQMWLAKNEGIFVEPASATPVAKIFKYTQKNKFPDNSVITLTATGNGLKDIETATKSGFEPLYAPANSNDILEKLGF